jgi:hypothetical protein
MKFLAAFGMILIFNAKSFSQKEWILVGVQKSGDSTFMRSHIVSQANDEGRQDVIKIWMRTTHKSLELGKKTYKNVVLNSLMYVDCDAKQMKTGNVTLYSRSGDPLYSGEDIAASYTDVIPDSMGEKIVETVCSTFNK